jgi:phage tail sheath gpL-like
MSTVPFKVIPSNLRLPGAYFELDNSYANTAQQNQRALIIGQITAGGIATPNVPIISGGVGDAQIQGGAGSMLHLMTQIYRLNDAFGEVWYLPLADAASSVAAKGSINFTQAPTAAGTISLYIAGTLIAVPVAVGQTPASTQRPLLRRSMPRLPFCRSPRRSTAPQRARSTSRRAMPVSLATISTSA